MKNSSRTDRFWEKVRKTSGCWMWAGQSHGGYGRLDEVVGPGKKRNLLYAHRLSWEIHFGPIPEGLFVCHHCDVPACVNPSHLFLGDHAANSQDMVSKNRQVKGENIPHAKLSRAAAVEIRKRYSAGRITQQALAEEFGVAPSQINWVIHGKSWKS